MEKKYMKAKRIIVITMCTLICIMAVGYAAFATNLTITGTSNIGSTWKVEFTNIEEISKTSGVTITNPPTAKGTMATFNVDLTSPGDNIIYRITVANNGTLNAIIDDITASETGSDAINFEIIGIKKGDKLASKTTTTFDVTISYDNSVTSQPNLIDNTLTVNINYVQDTGQTVPPDDMIVVPTRLTAKILKDNEAQADTSIDFSQISSDTNGKGLYYTSTNTEDNKTTYYFRGAVENNYVTFAGFTWRIVRINEDGSIRLIKQDSIGKSSFNEKPEGSEEVGLYDNAYVGYMYGTIDASTYRETHANVNSSTIKTFIDEWYQNNLINYSHYLADIGFCGDRSTSTNASVWDSKDTTLGYGKNKTYYGAYNRSQNTNIPQFKCPQESDLYTTSTSSKGNKALIYPIGLLTYDDAVYAGMNLYGGLSAGTYKSSSYLGNGTNYWIISPYFATWAANLNIRSTSGYIQYANVAGSMETNPVINLKSTVEISNGEGTVDNPYVIKTN